MICNGRAVDDMHADGVMRCTRGVSDDIQRGALMICNGRAVDDMHADGVMICTRGASDCEVLLTQNRPCGEPWT